MYGRRSLFPAATRRDACYGVELLNDVQLAEGGVAHGDGPTREILPWSRVLYALAAEVGEPEGVRTVVFDLVVERSERACRVHRFDADPGPDAQAAACVIAKALGVDRVNPPLRNAAADGYPNSWYPDLEAFEEAAIEALVPLEKRAES